MSFEEQLHAAIAEALAIPLGTVKSRIRLAVATCAASSATLSHERSRSE
ncbi:MAG: hypothetical protein IPG57_16080 [Burkholderiales bacterium]|nr:hypothetical protein [Burkholderiales bacterium]